MKKLLPFAVLVLYATGTGVFWRHDSDLINFLLLVARPFCASVLICFLWARLGLLAKLLVTTAVVALIQMVSTISYGASTRWWNVLQDHETHAIVALSFGVSLVVALFTTLVVSGFRKLIGRKQPNNKGCSGGGAIAEPPTAPLG